MSLPYLIVVLTFAFVASEPQWEHTLAERMRLLGPLTSTNKRIQLPCKTLTPSPTVPTSVHALRVADIQHVAAMGDSISAGNGAKANTIFGVLLEYRGVSWSIGGDDSLEKVITLPNIMRKFNRNLNGFSRDIGDQNNTKAYFNVAKPSSVSADMPGQAELLVKRMRKALGDTRFENEWKLVTLFIGGNDLCFYCKETNRFSPENYRNNIKTTLEILYQKMPRTLVNFVTVNNVAEVKDLHKGAMCQSLQGFLCQCAVDERTREQTRATSLEYQRLTTELVDDPNFCSDRDDFAIVRQPFMERMKIPVKTNGAADFSYFAPDCFHLSKKGHESAAIELWNNMMQRIGQKSNVWDLADILQCPNDDNGYIYTARNSK